jgi:hypothetical protein
MKSNQALAGLLSELLGELRNFKYNPESHSGNLSMLQINLGK